MRLRPSERHRWARCSGYPAFHELLVSSGRKEDTSNINTWRGTVGHEISAELLEPVSCMPISSRDIWSQEPTETLRKAYGYVQRVYKHPDADLTYVVDKDLIVAVCAYITFIATIMPKGDLESMAVEREVSATQHCKGTADLTVYHRGKRHLHVVDAKFGKGVQVVASDNLQLQAYAVGRAKQIKSPIDRISLTIVQPAFGEPQTSAHDISELRAWAVQIESEEQICLSPEKRQLVSGSWCKWCVCMPHCPAVEQIVKNYSEHASTVPIALKDAAALGRALCIYEDIVLPYGDELRKAVRRQLEAGASPADAIGWQLTPKRARRQWIDADSTGKVLSAIVKDRAHMLYDARLKSPAQLEALIKNGSLPISAEDLVAYWESKSSGLVLKRSDNLQKQRAHKLRGLGPLTNISKRTE